ncbi:glyoxylate reductase [Streptomyces sp. PRh5]|uniref:2-hydroxyacid dehydrogenase n=1 Tax=Streptomyces sp. PRh5 TaxID=1158056 RepID=UPI00044BB25A|nr:D-glycerate dehydrogenase [Streptomyces sp. PRh5]EXU62510.1 glyoxylate reductase [Streptomyces sp. PRh5]
MTFRIASTVPLPTRSVTMLNEHGIDLLPVEGVASLATLTGIAAVIVTITDPVDDSATTTLRAAGVRLIANVGVGYNNINVPAAAKAGITVTNTPDVLTDATADLTMALLLDATRRVTEGDRLIRSGTPWSWAFDFMWGSSLAGKRLGIVGYGRIGEAVACRARAFGMTVASSSRRPRTESDVEWMSLERLFAESDVISLHCPLTEDTRHLVDADRLRSMKRTAVLINTARGPIVDEAALVDALRQETIAAAGLDVYEHEPLLSPGLAELANVTLAPHLGSATQETREAMADLAVRNVVALRLGTDLLTPVAG